MQSLMVPPWVILSWPAVEGVAGILHGQEFVHIGTRLIEPQAEGEHRRGSTLWVSKSPDRQVGLAWDWVEIEPQVLALSDPLGVITNLEIVDAAGQPLKRAHKAANLVWRLGRLGWQEVVLQAIDRRQPPADQDALDRAARAMAYL